MLALQMQLHSVLVFDKHLQGIPIAWVISERNEGDDFALWMASLQQAGRDACPDWRPSAFIIDCSLAQVNGIRYASTLRITSSSAYVDGKRVVG